MTSGIGTPDLRSEIPFSEELKFALELEPLKDLERQNPLASAPRRERVAEHSWHVALAAILLQDSAAEEIDLGRAVILSVIHDVVEQFVGDTFAFGDEVADQESREHDAMQKLRESSTTKGIRRLVEYWFEYERQETPEARFVKGLDAILPIVQNFSNPAYSSWKQHQVPADKVRARLRSHGDAGSLTALAEHLIAEAQKQGVLR